MELKYFYYISKYKVDMLLDQLHRTSGATANISPRIEFAGLSLGADITRGNDKSLVQRTLLLLKLLKEKKLLRELRGYSELDTEYFYHDDRVWSNGILTFNANEKTVAQAYVPSQESPHSPLLQGRTVLTSVWTARFVL